MGVVIASHVQLWMWNTHTHTHTKTNAGAIFLKLHTHTVIKFATYKRIYICARDLLHHFYITVIQVLLWQMWEDG